MIAPCWRAWSLSSAPAPTGCSATSPRWRRRSSKRARNHAASRGIHLSRGGSLSYDDAGRVIAQLYTMTLQEQAEARRSSVGTKVLLVGLGVFAVLGSFWTIVWFIRAYVEAPRVNNAPMALAARESTPVPPAPIVAPVPITGPQQAAAPPSVITA